MIKENRKKRVANIATLFEFTARQKLFLNFISA